MCLLLSHTCVISPAFKILFWKWTPKIKCGCSLIKLPSIFANIAVLESCPVSSLGAAFQTEISCNLDRALGNTAGLWLKDKHCVIAAAAFCSKYASPAAVTKKPPFFSPIILTTAFTLGIVAR